MDTATTCADDVIKFLTAHAQRLDAYAQQRDGKARAHYLTSAAAARQAAKSIDAADGWYDRRA